jgi:hypothetical protein
MVDANHANNIDVSREQERISRPLSIHWQRMHCPSEIKGRAIFFRTRENQG